MKKEIGLSFGVSAGSLEDQLKEQGYRLSEKDLAIYKKVIEGWNIMRFRRFTTDAEADRIAKRILDDIAKRVELIGEARE